MAFAKPQFGKGRVDAAGDTLIEDYDLNPSDDYILAWISRYEEALAIISNWRSSHSFPLQSLKMTLLRRATKVDKRAIVAQRIKRLPSIELKLRRNKNMKLSQMQDIGGCRAVVRTAGHVRRLVELYQTSREKNPHQRHEFVKPYDYIACPKKDGYRSVHLVYKYRSKSRKHEPYTGLRIEIQLRSRLQHYWATAVETVSTLTGHAYKSNIGDEAWKRFFALMGSVIAIRERCPIVPGTPKNQDDLKRELQGLVKHLRVETVLEGWSATLNRIPVKNSTNAASFLLVLDVDAKTIRVTSFDKQQLGQASERYLEVEKEIKDKAGAQAVLVSVSSLEALRSAYPNYYLDTTAFVDVVREAVK